MKYIQKTIVDDEGEPAVCHVAVTGHFSLLANSAGLKLRGYKDSAAFIAGKRARLETPVSVDLTTLTATCGDMPPSTTIYDALWAIMSERLICDESSPFYGGTIKDTEEV